MKEQNTPKMAHDEMIDVLKGLVFGTFDRTTAKEREALDMAIKKLEQDEEIKLEIDLGDEVVGDYGAKGVVVGMDTYKGEAWLSLLMSNHKVPQFVKASRYKTKTGRHFPQIVGVLEQIKREADTESEG